MMEAVPTLEEIVRSPTTARVPADNDPGSYYAVAGMLARSVKLDNIEPIMVYADRMIPDYQVSMVTDAVRRDPSLRNTQAYGEWTIKHQEIML